MTEYNTSIKSVINQNNTEIYQELKKFLKVQNDRSHALTGQVPTCLVVTSTESASSIETQFQAMCDELKSEFECLNVVLDDRKCGTMKNAIEHIMQKLRFLLNIKHNEDDFSKSGDTNTFQQEESGDDMGMILEEAHESDEEDDSNNEEDKMEIDGGKEYECSVMNRSSNHISSVNNPSFLHQEDKSHDMSLMSIDENNNDQSLCNRLDKMDMSQNQSQSQSARKSNSQSKQGPNVMTRTQKNKTIQ